MFKEKNLSPKQLAALTALLLSSIIGISVFVLITDWRVLLAYFLACFVVIYFLVYQILEYFIYRKIKLIYKLISSTKASKREEAYQKYILPQKGIDDVREDVEQWAAQQTKQIQQLQSNEAFRKEFLQNLSHEIKTPIFAIQGYLELIADGAMEDPAIGNKFINQAQANVQRLVGLLNDVDVITNLEINKEPILKTSFIIQDLINEVVHNLSVKWLKKNIQFHYKKGSEDWIMFAIHPEQGNKNLIVECHAPIKDRRIVSDSGGHKQRRYVIETQLRLGQSSLKAEVTLTNRDSMLFRMLLGRTALSHHYLIAPNESFLQGEPNYTDLL